MTENKDPPQQGFSTHRFRVGAFTCIAIDDGGFVYEPPSFPRPADFLFASAPSKEVVDVALKSVGLDRNTWVRLALPFTCILIDTGTDLILIDTGAGDFAPGTGQLVGALASLGISPTDIGVVIITHGHWDHINGCTDDDGRSPRFPKARYVISAAEYEFWRGEQCEKVDLSLGGTLIHIARSNLTAIGDRLERITGAAEIVPGVTARPAHGHTPGHIVVEVDGRQGHLQQRNDNHDGRLVVLGCVFVHPLHCSYPHFAPVVDVTKDEATTTRRLLLDELYQRGCLVHGYHFPFPGLGRIEADGKVYKFRSSLDLVETSPQ